MFVAFVFPSNELAFLDRNRNDAVSFFLSCFFFPVKNIVCCILFPLLVVTYLRAIPEESTLAAFQQRVFPLTASVTRPLAVSLCGISTDLVAQFEKVVQRRGDNLGSFNKRAVLSLSDTMTLNHHGERNE